MPAAPAPAWHQGCGAGTAVAAPAAARRVRDAARGRAHGDDDRLRLESLEWLSGLPLRHGEPVKARIRFETRAAVSAVAVGIGFSNFEGARLLTYETDFQDGSRPDLLLPGKYKVDVAIDPLPLAPDIYNVDVGCRSGDFHGLDYLPACSQAEIIAGLNTSGTIVRKAAGVRLSSEWSWEAPAQATELQLVG
jgi:hypothetical protein